MLVLDAASAPIERARASKARIALTIAIGLIVAVCVAGMVVGAWLSDDYLIGLRQSLNLVHGRGFSFFANARVQTMTSPLWGVLLAPVLWVFDAFYAPMIVSIALSAAALAVLGRIYWRRADVQIPLLLAAVLLAGSKSYIDFSTSGLENPLAHIVAACLFAAVLRHTDGPSSATFRRVCVAAALLCLTRYDFAILVVPSVVWGVWQLRRSKQYLPGVLAFGGIVAAWMLFALVYFGTILPNAFYAKLTTGIPLKDSLAFGLKYYQATWIHDPTSLIGVSAGLVIGLIGRKRRGWLPLGAGIVLYLLYIIPAGGDFMIGRFLSVPVLLSAALLVDGLLALGQQQWWKPAAALAAYFMVVRPDVPLLDNYASRESMRDAGKSAEILPRINDEKKAYVFDRGLLTGHKRFAGWLANRVELWREAPNAAAERAVMINCGGLGWLSFEYGPDAYVYDLCALADPFLSKLPLLQTGADHKLLPWGPGHFTRSEPAGYTDSLAFGTNLVADPVLAGVFDDVQRITTGPLFTWERWKSIYRLATMDVVRRARAAPSYAGFVAPKNQETYSAPYAFYTNAFRSQCTPEELATTLPTRGSLAVSFDGITHAPTLRLTATPGSKLHLSFKLRGKEAGVMDVEVPKACATGLGILDRGIPAAVAAAGFDSIVVSAAPAAQSVKVGGLVLNGVPFKGPGSKKGDLIFDKPGCALPNHGEAGGSCTVFARANSGSRGHLTYGPYLSLPPGGYVFELKYRSSAPATIAAGEWDAALRVGPVEHVLARGNFPGTNNASTTSTGRFWVPPGQSGAIEIRTSPRADVDTEVSSLRVYATVD